MEQVLHSLPRIDDPNVLVDFSTSDDAAVYRQPDGSLLIATLDFFTPIVNDPFDYGAIAAANALSDIYAMNAVPLFALNIIGFPKNDLPLEILEQILQGGSKVAGDAGIFVLGGHSIDDKEPKYGMVVIGRIENPADLVSNRDAHTGDSLVLTKPLGTGIINTAIKHRTIQESEVQDVIASMKTLNRDAARLAKKHAVHAMTDVTGFGLLGHLLELLEASGQSAGLFFDEIPVFERVVELIANDEVPGGTRRNLLAARNRTDFGDLAEEEQILLADAQTSGGLLLSMAESNAKMYVSEMHSLGHTATSIIGRIREPDDAPGITIEPAS